MKNITLSIDEEVLATVRLYAATHDISINRLVREYLSEIAQREDRAKKARQTIRTLSEQSDARIGLKAWSRDALHER